MTQDLASRLGVGQRELVAFVGGGGKTTLSTALGRQLAAAGRVALTTTTRMGADEVGRFELRCTTADPAVVARSLAGPGLLAIVVDDDGRKATGPAPEEVDALFRARVLDHLLVEADGARRRPFKAPAAHEPVIPAASTLVVVVMGADALDGVIAEVCHRPERVAELAGLAPEDRLDVETAARVIGHEHGGLKGVPPDARVVVAITKVDPDRRTHAEEIARLLDGHRRIERVSSFSRSARRSRRNPPVR